MKKILILFSFVLILSACQVSEQNEPEQVACTQEAKICPDGSSVGRTALNCEFAACPESIDIESESENPNTNGWKLMKDEKTGVSFKYPDPLGKKYISLLAEGEFLPNVKIFKGEFSSCEEETEMIDGPGASQKNKMIEGKNYCVKIEGDAAAGSSYTTYTYTVQNKTALVSLNFTLRQPNCGNYDEPKQSECKREQADFNPDDLAIQILKTVSF